MYRTRQYHVKEQNRLYPYCRDLCKKSAVLYNRANFIIRQYATAAHSFSAMRPLYDNQMQVFKLVNEILAGTKYLGDNSWLSYNAIDRILRLALRKDFKGNYYLTLSGRSKGTTQITLTANDGSKTTRTFKVNVE